MSKKLKIGSALALVACAAAFAKDPIVMKINGVDVPRSEFEYLYHKNSQQQLERQSFDDYVEMFKIYKLKVADALAAGIDTTAAFRNELAQYQRELALPYLTDSAFIEKLVREDFDFLQNDREIRHIMFFRQNDRKVNEANKATLDSLRQCIKNGESFAALATKYSQDRGTNGKGGYMGYMSFDKIPFYSFMKTAFTTPEGEVSDVVETQAGYHLLLGGKSRPARGQMLAHHILALVRPGSPESAYVAAKEKMDSVYNVLMQDPSQFEKIAAEVSDDKASARNGGLINWFNSDDMVPDFSDAVWSLSDGEISRPVRSDYGYHIIRRDAHRDPFTLDQLRPTLVQRVTDPRGERAMMIRDNQNEVLSKRFKAKVNEKTLAQLKNDAVKLGVDSLLKANYTTGAEAKLPLITIGKNNIPVSDFVGGMLMSYSIAPTPFAADDIDRFFKIFLNNRLMSTGEEVLLGEEPDYANLYKEFRDGSLLYEISLQKVWDKAAKDEAGLKRYFENHRSDYKWTEPHVKGYLVQSKNDSISQLVRLRMQELANTDSLLSSVRKEFRGKAQVDKILFAKGQNPIVDYVVFGGPEVQSQNATYTDFFVFDPVILTEPQEVADVKGLVTSDYQNQLEREWIDRLKNRYPVEINWKELKKLDK